MSNFLLLVNSSILRFCILLLCVAFIVLVFMRNISLRRKVQIENGNYRTLVHEAVREAINAEECGQENPVQALVHITRGQTKIATAAQLVGGAVNLQHLSGGLNISNIINDMAEHERQMNAVVLRKGFIKPTVLSQYTHDKNINDEELA